MKNLFLILVNILNYFNTGVEVKDNAYFTGNSWVELPSSLFSSQDGSSQRVSFDLTTQMTNGIIFWYGKDPKNPARGEDYLSLGSEYYLHKPTLQKK